VTEQLTLDLELAAMEGLGPWMLRQPVPPWADADDPRTTTVADLARSARCSPLVMEDILADEEARGHVERAGDGWRATRKLIEAHRDSFRELS
jgi:Mg2+ and Co2+ transporter CorA